MSRSATAGYEKCPQCDELSLWVVSPILDGIVEEDCKKCDYSNRKTITLKDAIGLTEEEAMEILYEEDHR